MARLPRLVLPGHAHLVVQRSLGDRPVFADHVDRQTYLDALRDGLTAEQVQLHAYALVAHEARLVLTPPSAAALARLMQHLGRRYVSAHNHRHGRRGTVWDGRYRCAALQSGEACLDAMLWVEAAADDSGTSNEARHAGVASDALLSDPPAYWALGNTPFEREAAYRQRLDRGLPPSRADELRRALAGGWVVGTAAFAAEAEADSGRPSRPRPRGRPRRVQNQP